MCLTLTLAWKNFGHQRYVLLWAISYGIAVLQWVFNVGGLLLKSPALMTVASACIVASGSLVVIGARQRARLDVHVWPFIIGGGLAIVGCAIVNSIPTLLTWQAVIPSSYTAGMMAAAAMAVWPRNRSFRAPEGVFFAALVLFTMFQCGLVGAAFTITPGESSPGLDIYRAILGIGLPSIYVATGVTAVVVIAGDLAMQLRLLVSNDQLTGLLNRRGIDDAGARAIASARRHGRKIAAVICDMDSFKAVNDGHGHIVGDAALRAFSRVLLGAVRQDDICARFGGDEFCVLLQDASEQEAADVMERVRVAVEHLVVDRMPPGSISASFGITSLQAGDNNLDDLIARADRALYQSKQKGRNRVTIWRDGDAAATPVAETVIGTAAR